MLLVKIKNTDYWCLPGGGLEESEPLEEGLRREIIEELGVEPVIGQLLYIQQLFFKHTHEKMGDESLEFFFNIENVEDFAAIDISATTHGMLELSEVAFMPPSTKSLKPDFLDAVYEDLHSTKLPKIYTRYA